MKINHENRTLVMDRTFSKNADIVGSREYNLLQEARRDYPGYETIRKTIRKKETQERYKGLTYEYMEWYINEYETKENLWKSLEEQRSLRPPLNCLPQLRSPALVRQSPHNHQSNHTQAERENNEVL